MQLDHVCSVEYVDCRDDAITDGKRSQRDVSMHVIVSCHTAAVFEKDDDIRRPR